MCEQWWWSDILQVGKTCTARVVGDASLVKISMFM